ncbi:MAG: class I SAM-dependent methyltransferase [Gemmatimonadaceae bacterium]
MTTSAKDRGTGGDNRGRSRRIGADSEGGTPAHDAPGGALRHSREVLAKLFGPPDGRDFAVRYWDGTLERGRQLQPPFTFRIERPGALRRMLLPPNELSIIEAYLSGDVDIEGRVEDAATLGDAINRRIRSPRTLGSIVRHLIALPKDGTMEQVRAARAERSVERTGSQHDKVRDRAAVQFHYDIGNEFYQLWLDQRMVYSCAYFETPDTSLDDAQVAKLELICRKLRLRPGERLLDVGCGWGALIMHAARQHGVEALGITLSENQAALARERIAAAGLSDRVKVELRDYRDLAPDARFDKIASVGMVEHVGLAKLPVYFAALHRALAPRGLLLNHGIISLGAARPHGWRDRVEAKLWRRNAFIEQYVFPDGQLVPLQAVIGAAEGAGFETRDVESLREHYALTLRHWTSRLLEKADRAIAIAGERTYRVWRLYMAASAHAFASGSINIVQTLLAKSDENGEAGLPLTREDLYARR